MKFTFLNREYEYEGNHALGENICTIRWNIEDLVIAMAEAGIEPTDENIDKVLAHRFERTLHERSVEEGWEIIDVIISNVF